MSHRWVKWGVAGASLAAGAGAYAYRWRKRYKEILADRQIEAMIMDMVPEDVIGGSDVDLGEIAEFDSIAEYTCMDPCCYTPLTDEQADEYGYSETFGYLDFPDF